MDAAAETILVTLLHFAPGGSALQLSHPLELTHSGTMRAHRLLPTRPAEGVTLLWVSTLVNAAPC